MKFSPPASQKYENHGAIQIEDAWLCGRISDIADDFREYLKCVFSEEYARRIPEEVLQMMVQDVLETASEDYNTTDLQYAFGRVIMAILSTCPDYDTILARIGNY